MSLINQMLADLEARKGGRLQRVDAALDGLHAAPLRVVTERPRAMLGALVVFGACAALWTSRAPLSDFLRLSPAPSLMRVASEFNITLVFFGISNEFFPFNITCFKP